MNMPEEERLKKHSKFKSSLHCKFLKDQKNKQRQEWKRQGRKGFYWCLVSQHSCSVISNSLATPWTVAHQAPLSMGYPRQERQSGLPFPSPGDLPDPGIVPAFPVWAGEFFTTDQPLGKHRKSFILVQNERKRETDRVLIAEKSQVLPK